MELLQLRYFKDAAELENFSMVAKKNMVPQPSISKTIGKLEDELGVLLFDRQGKRIVLNDNGKFFYEKVSTALNNIDSGIEHFKAPVHKDIKIYTQAGSRFVSLLTADFLYSTRDIFISSVNQLSLDNKNGYDFTFMQPQKDMNGLKYEKLMDDPIVAVISTKNPLSSSSLLSIKDLRDEQFVAYYRSINLRDFTDDFCKNVGGFVPNVAFESHDYSSIRYMISKNKGIGLMPEKFFRLQPYPNIKIVPLKEQVFRTLVIAWNENTSLSKQAINFLQFTKNGLKIFNFYFFMESCIRFLSLSTLRTLTSTTSPTETTSNGCFINLLLISDMCTSPS